MNSHFSGFQNRQKISESKKTSRREKLETRKTDLIDYGINNKNEAVFISSIPEDELNKIKLEIRNRITYNKRKQAYYMITAFALITILVVIFAIKQKVF